MLIGHQKQWEFLKNKLETNQLSHAYLFTGQEGIGKLTFVKEFADLVACKFPDLMIVEPEEGKEISIAKIRDVQNFLAYKSYNGGLKIVVVDNAELMNQEAQSCFLKTLEEPKEKTLIFLVTCKPEMILPTIFSRCQQIKFFKPKGLPKNSVKQEREDQILSELLPVLNADFAEKFKYVKEIDFEKQNAQEIIYVLQKHLRRDVIKNKKILELTEEISKNLILTNANPKLALEILLMEI